MTENEYIAAKLSNELNMGHIEEVERLLEQGADINCKDALGNTPLMEAAYTGQPDMVRLLIKAGADAAARNIFGRTARRLAEEIGHDDIVATFSEMSVSD